MARHTTCDGMHRRDFLRVGALGTGAFTLGSFLKMSEAGEINPNVKAKSAIFIDLAGGASHLDTFDLKPEAPDEYRGDFQPIETSVPGIQICEHLPNLAKAMEHFTILRGVSHTLAVHEQGSRYVNTGNRPLASLEYPGYGAVVSKELDGPRELPKFVSIPNSNQKPGYLGVQYAPLNTNQVPQAGKPFSVRGISLGGGVTIEDIERRQNLLQRLDVAFTGFEENSQLIQGLDRFSEQAYAMLTSSRARDAFDISKESPEFTKTFKNDGFSQSCLLATRLVESGVRFVTITNGGWDTHNNNWKTLKERLLPNMDNALSSLFVGLKEKGMLDSTLVFVTGEFGRTPKINQARVGRDHHPRCMFMLMAGGGVPGGRVLGGSDETATMPADGTGFSPDSVAASFYHALGVDFTKEYHTTSGRPMTIVRDGTVIEELFS